MAYKQIHIINTLFYGNKRYEGLFNVSIRRLGKQDSPYLGLLRALLFSAVRDKDTSFLKRLGPSICKVLRINYDDVNLILQRLWNDNK